MNLQTEGRPPFADVSLTPWRELAMLTAPTAGQLENVPTAVPLQDYDVGFAAVQAQEQLQWNGANNMMELVHYFDFDFDFITRLKGRHTTIATDNQRLAAWGGCPINIGRVRGLGVCGG